MLKIGQILKARREELGFSLAKMSERTKVPLSKLQAIEDGNLAYFKHELTYVKFYVRYYFNNLHLNFDDYKELLNEALDEYTQTASLKNLEEHAEINARVKHRANSHNEAHKAKTQPFNIKKNLKVDIGFISMFVISIMIILALLYVFISSVYPMLTKTKNDPKVIVVPDPIVYENEPVKPVDPIITVEFAITKTGLTQYEITGAKVNQETTFIIKMLNSMSWLSSKVDGVYTMNPARGYYKKGESLSLIVKAQEGMIVELNIGYLASPQITVNGVNVLIDQSLVASKLKRSFFFTFKGVTS